MEVLIGVVLLVIVIGPIMAVTALHKASRNRNRLDFVSDRLSDLYRKITSLEAAIVGLEPAGGRPAEETSATDFEPEAEDVEAPAPDTEDKPTEPEPAAPPPPAPPPPVIEPRPARLSLEQRLTSSWMIWIAGIALALGGGFLVKYSIDVGLLGPKVRIALGLLAAAAMIVAGEWIRRHPPKGAIASVEPDYLPGAATAAGIFTAYATVFAAYSLYGLFAAPIAFVLLVFVAFGALILSLAHGSFIAGLGIIGAYVVPIIVSTGSHEAWALFPYLVFVAAAALAVVRYRNWWKLGWLNLAGAAIWPWLWFIDPWRAGDGTPMGIYLVLISAMFLAVRYRPVDPVEELESSASPWNIDRLPVAEKVAFFAATLAQLTALWLVAIDNHGPASLITIGALATLTMAVARREAIFEALPVVAAALVIAAIAIWDLPSSVAASGVITAPDGLTLRIEPGPMIPVGLGGFVGVAAAFAGLFGGACFAALWGARRPALWASLSAATPVALLIIVYGRVNNFEVDLAWAMTGLALAAIILAAAERVARYRETPGMVGALGAYAVGAIAALTLAATMMLEEAWLTVALALQIPAIGWVHDKLALKQLRWVALLIAGAVLVRLGLNVDIFSYHSGSLSPGANWLLYGYGAPAAAFFAASRIFRKSSDDVLVHVLEAGTLLFLVLLASLEIRTFFTDGGRLDGSDYQILEQSLQTLTWLAFGHALLILQRRARRPVLVWGRRILGALAAAQIVFLQLLTSNPLFTGDAVGTVPIFNILLLAYAAPAVGLVFMFREAKSQGDKLTEAGAGIFALVLAFVWLSLEVRHAFHGTDLASGTTTDFEWYAYSFAWLVYGGCLLSLGIWRNNSALRYASLTTLLLVITKVFLFDMAALDSLFRAFSFLGLGAALIAVVFFYQRYVFPPKAAGPAETP